MAIPEFISLSGNLSSQPPEWQLQFPPPFAPFGSGHTPRTSCDWNRIAFKHDLCITCVLTAGACPFFDLLLPLCLFLPAFLGSSKGQTTCTRTCTACEKIWTACRNVSSCPQIWTACSTVSYYPTEVKFYATQLGCDALSYRKGAAGAFFIGELFGVLRGIHSVPGSLLSPYPLPAFPSTTYRRFKFE